MSDRRYRLEFDEAMQKATRAVQHCEHLIKRAPEEAAKMQARLSVGVFIAGAQKGQPLTAHRRDQLAKERDHWFRFRDEQIEALPGLEAELARIQTRVGAETLSR